MKAQSISNSAVEQRFQIIQPLMSQLLETNFSMFANEKLLWISDEVKFSKRKGVRNDRVRVMWVLHRTQTSKPHQCWIMNNNSHRKTHHLWRFDVRVLRRTPIISQFSDETTERKKNQLLKLQHSKWAVKQNVAYKYGFTWTRSILTRMILFFEVFIFSLIKRVSSRTSLQFSFCIAYSQTAVIYYDFNFKYFKGEKISNFVKRFETRESTICRVSRKTGNIF